MKHSSPIAVPAAVWAALALALPALGTGCATDRVRPAPFRVRPDSIEVGSLLGPFSGRVVDAASGEPVPGALVYATWTLASGYGVVAPGGVREVVASTDSDGRYQIDRLEDVPDSGSLRLTDFTLVVYKRGYVAYRSDRRFFDLGPRMDFAQLRNEVSLERWREDFSHLRHLRYIGGGSALSALTSWEADEAAAELSGLEGAQTRKIAAELTPSGRAATVVAAQLLSEKDVKEVTGFEGAFETGPLGDEPDTAAYSSQHFKALGQPQNYDVALRLWKLPPEAAEKRYGDIIELLSEVERSDEIGDKSFRASEGGIVAIGFLDAKLGVVVMLTCGEAQCTTEDMALRLARTAYQGLVRLTPTGGR